MCPLPAPVPVTKMCHTLYVPAFLLPTLSQGSPPPVSVLIRQPTRNHSAPLQGLLPPITVQFRLAYVPSCSVLIQHPTVPPPHFYAYLVHSLLSPTNLPQPHPSLPFHSSLTLSPNYSQSVMSFTCCLSPDPQTGNTPQHPALIHSGQTLIQSSNPNHQNPNLALH